MSRRGRSSRHHDTDATRPRVPIIPMLDLAFQLLAFGLTLFDLAPQVEEGQFTLPLPKSGENNPIVAPPPDKLDEPPEEFSLLVTADRSTGRIRSAGMKSSGATIGQTEMQLAPQIEDGKDANGQPRPGIRSALQEQVKRKAENKEPVPTLEVQFDLDLNYQVVIEILGVADAAKFKKVTPNALGSAKPVEPMAPAP